MSTRVPANQTAAKTCLTTSPSRFHRNYSLVSLVWLLLMVWLTPPMTAQAQGFVQQTGATNPFNAISTRGFGPDVTLADLDGDSDLDLLTVDANGNIAYYQNTGTPTTPNYVQAANPIGLPTEGVRYYLGFRFADLDGDGDLDAVTGNSDGVILSYRNTGTRTSPSFTQLTGSSNPFAAFQYTSEDYSVVAPGDFDGDGDADVLVITGNGIHYLRNTGSVTLPIYTEVTGTGNPFEGIVEGDAFFISGVADMDRDGDLDLAVTNYRSNSIDYYQNVGTPTIPLFVRLTGPANPFNGFVQGAYLSIGLGDVDGDGDADAVVGVVDRDYGGPLIYLKNVLQMPQQSTPASQTVCVGGLASTTVQARSGSAITYQWYRNAQNTTTPVTGQTSATLQLTNVKLSDAGVYYARAAGGGGTLYSTAFTLNVQGVAIAQQPVSGSSVCAGTIVTASVSTSGTATGYQWYRNGTVVTGQTFASLTLPNTIPTQNGNYSVVVTSSCNSVTSTAFSLTVNALPTAYTVTGGGSICTGGAGITIDLSDSQTGVTYQLLRGNTATGAAIAGTGNPISFPPQSTAGTYTVVATNTTANCTQAMSGSANVVVNSPPSVSITPSAAAVCEGQRATLTATPGLTSYVWSNGQTTASISVSASGTYSVTATNTSGCSASASANVTVNDPPIASLLVSGPLTCQQTSVTLTAGGGNSYTFSAGATQLSNTNQALVSATGIYSVTVANASGCRSTTSVIVSQDNTAPLANLVSSGTLSCAVTSVTLTANPGGLSYVFSAGSAQLGSTNQAVVTVAGIYSVTVISGNGCTATTSTTVEGDQNAPTASLTNSGPLSCSNTSITLIASGGSTYRFSPGANQIGNGSTATVSTAGVYSVTVAGSNGCSSVASTTVTGDQTSPTVNINPTTAILTCAMPTAILTATTPANSLTWSTGQTTNSISVSVSGTYSVTVTSPNGCIAMAQAAVSGTSSAPTVPTLTASPAPSTTNQPITVTANGCTGGTINWTALGGTGQASGNTYTLSQPGNYTLSATCSLNGCTSPASTPLAVQIRPGGFAITGVSMVNCQLIDEAKGGYQVQFTPQYSGQNGNPISFAVINELAATTAPAPYSLRLYTDNPVITLVVTQTGNAEARFAYNWLASCQSGTSPNQPPTTTGIPSQTIIQGQGYQLQLASYFSDPDGQTLSFQAQSLPVGLALTGSVISGTPSQTGVSSVNVTALDPLGLTVSTNFQLTVSPQPVTPPTGFAIVGVSTVSCQVLSPGERRLTFTPQYAGASGTPISFSVVNELVATTNPGPYSLNLYTDNPTITLSAQQGASVTIYSYNWLAVCTPAARVGTREVNSRLQVRVLGNPIEGQTAEVEISGVNGQSIQLNLVDLHGRSVHAQKIEQASAFERVSLPLGASNGVLLLRVSTLSQSQQVKLLRTN